MAQHTHLVYDYNPDEPDYRLKPDSLENYVSHRSKQNNNNLKDRSNMVFSPPDVNLYPGTTSSLYCDANSFFLTNPYQQIFKGVGFTHPGEEVAKTSTSNPNFSVVTDGMGSCIATFIGGENRDLGKNAIPGGSLYLSHSLVENKNIADEAEESLRKVLEIKDLFPVIAMKGGDRSNASHNTVAVLNDVFQSANVPLFFDKTCDKQFEAIGNYSAAPARERNPLQA